MMDSTLSVSKGCFVLKPERAKKHKRAGYEHEAWHRAFNECWQLVEDKIQAIHDTAFSEVLGQVASYVKLCRTDPVFMDVIPAVALLTGVSVPDHAALFTAVCDKLRQEVTPYVASLHGDECRTVKVTVEKLVTQFVNNESVGQDLDDTITEFKVKKSKCTLAVLSAWYKSLAVTFPGNEAGSVDVHAVSPGSFEDSGHLLRNSPKIASEIVNSVSTPCKSELLDNSNHLLGKFSTWSPINSAKKTKSPFKQLCTPTKSPRKLMIAKRLLLQSPDAGKTNTLSERSSFETDRAKENEKSKRSLSSLSKHKGISSLKSPCKVQTSNTTTCKVRSDLSESVVISSSASDIPVCEHSVRWQISPSKYHDVLGSSPKMQVSTKKGLLIEVDREALSDHKILDSIVVLTPLKANLMASPPSSSKLGCKSRRLSCKRQASTSPYRSPEAKKRKNGQYTPCQAVHSSRRAGISSRRVTGELDTNPLLVVVVPDFESFSSTVLKDLILIASGYVQELPLVFVFGVATTISAVHCSLPHHVSSKICIQVFQSRSSVDLLNQVVDEVLLCSDCPFMLGGRTIRLLMDIFLCYDFSVQAFVQRLKFCMLEHFLRGHASLCCSPSQLYNSIHVLGEDDLDQLRSLSSFRRYVESRPRGEQAPLLVDNQHFKKELERLLRRLHEHVRLFHNALRCLHALTTSLPKAPLGRNLRELYATAVSLPVADSAQYRECRRLLELQSRDELEARLTAASAALAGRKLGDLVDKLPQWVEQLRVLADVRPSPIKSPLKSPSKLNFGKHLNRSQFKQKISEMSRKVRPLSAYEELRKQVIVWLLEERLPQYLVPPSSLPFHEVLLFDELSVKKHLIPSPRAALHTALNNPQHYLQCECCHLPEQTAILHTMPDICIVYKLHLESGKLVNLYDWLQAFVAIICPGSGEESQEVDPCIQARFTQAVSELQFLGFIKSSKKKTDHVLRTTWGAC